MQAAMKVIQPCMRAVAFSTIHQFSKNNHCNRYFRLPRSSPHSRSLGSLSLSSLNLSKLNNCNEKKHSCYRQSVLLQGLLLPSQSTAPSSSSVALYSTKQSDSIIEINNEKDHNETNQQLYASSYHAPVMWKECIDALLKRSHNHDNKRKNKYKKKIDDDNDDDDDNQEGVTSKEEKVQLQNRPRIFIDGTLGGGGHSLCLLQNLSPGDIVIGCDVDPSALATASTRLKDYIVKQQEEGGGISQRGEEMDRPMFIPVNSNFKDLEHHIKALKHPTTGELLLYENGNDNNDNGDANMVFRGVDGILLDLGVSSHQIDNPERGFAFMKDGPLDMRMFGGKWNNYDNDSSSQPSDNIENNEKNNDGDDDVDTFYKEHVNNIRPSQNQGGLTAADICNEFDVEDIIRILKHYGDEPRARRIAQSIVESRPLQTTADLKNAVAKVTPDFVKHSRRKGLTATLARVFQSLRIVVNDEDNVLREALEDMAPSLIGKGGRLVVLTYHSMEDRAAKRVIRDGKVDGRGNRNRIEKDLFGNVIESEEDKLPWKGLGKKQKATDEEVKLNSRARSAMLRVAERL